MKTRSQIIRYLVNIDFDEASDAWKANKKYMGNGTYRYKCSAVTLSGNPCKRESLMHCDYCKIHMNKNTTSKEI